MKPLYRFLLKWVASKIVVQGPEHKKLITEYYEIMWHAARKEFTEDNNITLSMFLFECANDGIDKGIKNERT